MNYLLKLIAILLVFPAFMSGQTAEPTAKLSTVQKFNPFRVQGGAFDQRLFQADALLRLGDAYSTHRTVFDGTGRFSEADPIAPGENHSAWMTYGFQLGAHVALIQSHNLLVRHHHAKLARALVVADIAVEAFTVAQNVHNEVIEAPVAKQFNPVSR
jgi:hypothetical protein